MKETNDAPMFQASVDALEIARRLRKLTEGEIVTYEELSKLVPGRELTGRHRGLIYTAGKLVAREDKIIVGTVVKVGIKRLITQEVLDLSKHVTQHIRRLSIRTGRKIAMLDFDKLSSDQQTSYLLDMSMLGMINHVTRPQTYDALAEGVKKEHAKIDFMAAVKLLS